MSGSLSRHANADLASEAWGFALESFAAAAPGGWSRQAGSNARIVFTGAPIGIVNGVFLPSREHDVGEISAALALFDSHGPWTLQVRGEPGAEVARVAAEHGLARRVTAPLMIRSLTADDVGRPAVGAPFVRVVTGADQEAYGQALAEGKQVPRSTFEIFTRPPLLDAPHTHGYLAEKDGVGVSTAMTVRSDAVLGVFNVATVPAHRNRGYARAVTEAALSHGRRSGARIAFLHPTPVAERLYRDMGFEAVEDWTIFTTAS